MRASTTRPVRGLLPAILVAISVVVPAVPGSTQTALPLVAFEGSTDGIHTTVRATDQTGNAIDLNLDAEQFLTINGGRVAFTRHHEKVTFASDVVVKDAVTGERVWKVPDARYPLIFGGGDELVFLPDNNGRDVPEDRDAYVNSVWYRDLVSGDETKLVQFEDPDRQAMGFAVSPAGDQVAVTYGNDYFLYVWDIWVLSIDGSSAEPATTDGMSLYPSFSPDGQTIAFTHSDPTDPCDASVHLMDADGANPRVLTAGTCDANLLRPVWLDDQTIVAWKWAQQPGGWSQPVGLVTISADTGEILDQIASGFIADFVAARDAGQVIFRRLKGRIVAYDVAAGVATTVPGGKELPGWHLHAEGSLELAI
jgi:WD40 repeat protein